MTMHDSPAGYCPGTPVTRMSESCQTMNKTNEKSFLKHIAYLQIIGIILVVFGHSFHEYPDGNHGADLLIYRMLFSFRMPLFLFVSGYLMMYTGFLRGKDTGILPFARNKMKRLLLPFLVLSLIAFLPRVAMSAMADDTMDLSVGTFLNGLFYSQSLVIPFYWFLQTSFTLLVVCFTIIYLMRKYKVSDRYINLTLLILFIALPLIDWGIDYEFFSIGYTISLGIFFVLGIMFAQYEHLFDRYIRRGSIVPAIMFAALWAILFFMSGDSYIIYKLAGIAGIGMCIYLVHFLLRHNITVLNHLIGANYIIFLLSWFLNVASQQMLHHYVELPWLFFTILSLVTGIYIPYALYMLLKKHNGSRLCRGISFLLGQNISKRTIKKTSDK